MELIVDRESYPGRKPHLEDVDLMVYMVESSGWPYILNIVVNNII